MSEFSKSGKILGSTYFMGLLFLCAEIFAILIVYRFNFFDLLGPGPASNFCASYISTESMCRTIAGLSPTLLLLVFSILLIGVIKPKKPIDTAHYQVWTLAPKPGCSFLILSVVGLLLVLAPYFIVIALGQPSRVVLSLMWMLGFLLLVTPVVLHVAKDSQLRHSIKGYHVLISLPILLLPEISMEIDKRLWLETKLQTGTIELVILILQIMQQPSFQASPHIVGIRDFSVAIGSPCAGLSGIVFSAFLVLVFLISCRWALALHRSIILVPIAATLSWIGNSVRISLLLVVGEYYSPELAVDGFHSYAGWISITVISCTVMYSATRIAYFHHPSALPSNALPRTQSLNAAYILPFTVSMFTLILVGALSEHPETLYPLRITAVGLCLIYFWRNLPEHLVMPSFFNAHFVPAGLLAAIWIFSQTSTPEKLSDLLAGFSDLEKMLWMMFRISGTIIIAPIVEELFFRGYLLPKTAKFLKGNIWAALLITSLLFAALHNDFLLAFVASLLFGYVRIRTGKLINAISCHATTNSIIAMWALSVDDWSVI